ncbi:MAG: RNA polymerase sigma factor [Bacteroidales bacterium]|nr:RNA polymerase sigma factor [Bacteroidales bacterium]
MNFKIPVKEKELLEGCLGNDRFAQKRLYDLYKDAMYTLAYRMLRDEDLACDALQDGFIDVFVNLDKFEGKSTLGAWIKTIIIRKCLRKIEKERKKERLDESLLKGEMVKWDDELTGESLDKAINSLSPGYRSVFILVEVEGYSHKEAAEMLKISEGTSKSQLSRAKQQLQKMLVHLRN